MLEIRFDDSHDPETDQFSKTGLVAVGKKFGHELKIEEELINPIQTPISLSDSQRPTLEQIIFELEQRKAKRAHQRAMSWHAISAVGLSIVLAVALASGASKYYIEHSKKSTPTSEAPIFDPHGSVNDLTGYYQNVIVPNKIHELLHGRYDPFSQRPSRQ